MSGFDLPLGASAELRMQASSAVGAGLVCACALITAASAATSGDEKLVPAPGTYAISFVQSGFDGALQAPRITSFAFAVPRVMTPPPGANTATSALPKFE